MKENLFELLLNLFEKSLEQIKQCTPSIEDAGTADAVEEKSEQEFSNLIEFKLPEKDSERIIIPEERIKMTKAAYQFLIRLNVTEVIGAKHFEQIMNQVLFSDSRIVNLEEMKWLTRNTLENSLDTMQLDVLDNLLFGDAEPITIH